ncbi:LRK81-like protein [Mya arenaria]|uniref:LRK81-like protein n=1 Tax=Mya arenaria TaxID=6604 RepID=A0ABY7F5K7_MYAAR|nr:LRK81-like protein [Mya arenaria]
MASPPKKKRKADLTALSQSDDDEVTDALSQELGHAEQNDRHKGQDREDDPGQTNPSGDSEDKIYRRKAQDREDDPAGKDLPGLNVRVALKKITMGDVSDSSKEYINYSFKNEEIAARIRHFAVAPVFAKYEDPNGRKALLHLDIKSSNIGLDGNLNARLIDFGLAREIEGDEGIKCPEDTFDVKYIGTPGYFPTNPVRRLTKHLDYFSLGVVMRETITGANPGDPCTKHKFWLRNKQTLCECLWEQIKDLVRHDGYRNTASGVMPNESDSAMCEMCLVNKASKDNEDMVEHELSCKTNIKLCMQCVKSNYLNPVKCHSCNKCKPKIGGHNTACISIAGDGAGQKIYEKDATDFLEILCGKAHHTVCVRKLKNSQIKPSAAKSSMAQLGAALDEVNESSGIDTLILYFSGHGDKDKGAILRKHKCLLTEKLKNEDCKLCIKYWQKCEKKDYLKIDKIFANVRKHMKKMGNQQPTGCIVPYATNEEIFSFSSKSTVSMQLKIVRENLNENLVHVDLNFFATLDSIRTDVFRKWLSSDWENAYAGYADVLSVKNGTLPSDLTNTNDLLHVWNSKQLLDVTLRSYTGLRTGRVGLFPRTSKFGGVTCVTGKKLKDIVDNAQKIKSDLHNNLEKIKQSIHQAQNSGIYIGLVRDLVSLFDVELGKFEKSLRVLSSFRIIEIPSNFDIVLYIPKANIDFVCLELVRKDTMVKQDYVFYGDMSKICRAYAMHREF